MDQILQLFQDSAFVNFATFAMSLVAFIFSIITFLSGKSMNSRLLEIEENRDLQDATESKTAALRATESGTRREPSIRIENTGTGTARNINIEFDGKSMDAHAVHFMSPAPAVIGPMSETQIRYIATDQTHPPRTIKITWVDETGLTREYETTL